MIAPDVPEYFSTEATFSMKTRSQRRDRLFQLIGKHEGNIEKDHLLGLFMLENHVSLSTTYAYLQELKMAKVIVESDGRILSAGAALHLNEMNTQRLNEIVESAPPMNASEPPAGIEATPAPPPQLYNASEPPAGIEATPAPSSTNPSTPPLNPQLYDAD